MDWWRSWQCGGIIAGEEGIKSRRVSSRNDSNDGYTSRRENFETGDGWAAKVAWEESEYMMDGLEKKTDNKVHPMPKEENWRMIWLWKSNDTHCSLSKEKEGTKEDIDENARLNAFLINGVTGKIVCLKSVWLTCMYDCMIDYSWRKKCWAWRRKKRKTRGLKTEECNMRPRVNANKVIK